ncbi:MAG TPA: Hsp20/alpha crystallin family protein [Polyangiaceae bacterium]|nr:Hsp20/alpha crystallin family protein [Polyangiaceae bacterium]
MADTNLERREGDPRAPAPRRRAVAPAVDVFENKDEYLILADVPGAARDRVNVHFEHGRLTLEAPREFTAPGPVLASEYAPADYHRSFALPQGVDAARIEAELVAGVLRIRLPKSDAVRPRRIAIKGG